MSNIYFISGPCGCGKSTFANAYARHLVDHEGRKQVYLIHGDDFHQGFVESEDKGAFFVEGQASDLLLWKDILKFNWDCILTVANRALLQGLDIVIDYVIEEELPLVRKLAQEHHANLYYIVLTASEDAIRERIHKRGDVEMIDRALFLKEKLDNLPENQGHLYDNTGKKVEEEIGQLQVEQFLVV